jgi:hypothetical protein
VLSLFKYNKCPHTHQLVKSLPAGDGICDTKVVLVGMNEEVDSCIGGSGGHLTIHVPECHRRHERRRRFLLVFSILQAKTPPNAIRLPSNIRNPSLFGPQLARALRRAHRFSRRSSVRVATPYTCTSFLGRRQAQGRVVG